MPRCIKYKSTRASSRRSSIERPPVLMRPTAVDRKSKRAPTPAAVIRSHVGNRLAANLLLDARAREQVEWRKSALAEAAVCMFCERADADDDGRRCAVSARCHPVGRFASASRSRTSSTLNERRARGCASGRRAPSPPTEKSGEFNARRGGA